MLLDVAGTYGSVSEIVPVSTSFPLSDPLCVCAPLARRLRRGMCRRSGRVGRVAPPFLQGPGRFAADGPLSLGYGEKGEYERSSMLDTRPLDAPSGGEGRRTETQKEPSQRLEPASSGGLARVGDSCIESRARVSELVVSTPLRADVAVVNATQEVFRKHGWRRLIAAVPDRYFGRQSSASDQAKNRALGDGLKTAFARQAMHTWSPLAVLRLLRQVRHI